MKRSSPFTRGCVLTALTLGVPLAAMAQEGVLEEIIVTATKRGAASLQDVPLSIIAFDQQTLDIMGVEEFVDFSRSVPGLDVIDVGPGQKRYIARGISGPGEATVGLYFDNIPLTGNGQDASSFGGNQPDLEMFDTQQVEVLRGPQGTLYGASSVSGVVRMVSNKPDASGFDARLQVDGASVTDGGENFSLKGMINVPIGENGLAFRGVGYVVEDDGYIDNIYLFKDPSCYGRGDSFGLGTPEITLSPTCNDGTSNLTDVNDHSRTGLRAMLQGNTERTTFLGQVFYQEVETGGRNAIQPIDSEYFIGPPFIAGGNRFFTPATGEGYVTAIRGHEPYEEEMAIVAFDMTTDLDFAEFSLSASYMDRDSHSRIDSSSPGRLHRRFNECAAGPCGGMGLGPWGSARVSPTDHVSSEQFQTSETISLEARLASDFDGRLNYLAGFFYQDRTLDVNSIVPITDPRTGFDLPQFGLNLHRIAENTTEQMALFGEIYFDLTEQWQIMGGARAFNTDRDQFSNLIIPFVQSVPIGGPPGIETNVPTNESDTLFKAQVTYSPTENYHFFLQIVEGFRAGGVNARIVPNIPDSFASDTTQNLEIGAKTTWLDDRLIVNLAAYQTDWDDLQMRVAFTNQFSGLVNCTQQNDPVTAEGWELEIQALATDQLTLGMNFSSMDSTWNVDPESCLDAATLALLSDPVGGAQGDKLVGVPDHSGSVYLQYDFNLSNGLAGYFRTDVQFQGEVDRNERRVDRNIANPSYSLVHLKAGIESDRWGASVYVRNATDELAHLSLFNNFQQENRVTASRPRTVGVSVDFRF